MEPVHLVPDQCANFASHFSSVKIFQINVFNFASHFIRVQIFQIYFSLKNKKNPISTFPLQLLHSAMVMVLVIFWKCLKMLQGFIEWYNETDSLYQVKKADKTF